jgi:hypothetical protein
LLGGFVVSVPVISARVISVGEPAKILPLDDSATEKKDKDKGKNPGTRQLSHHLAPASTSTLRGEVTRKQYLLTQSLDVVLVCHMAN